MHLAISSLYPEEWITFILLLLDKHTYFLDIQTSA